MLWGHTVAYRLTILLQHCHTLWAQVLLLILLLPEGRESSGGWFESLRSCIHVGYLEEVPGSQLWIS